MKELNLLLWLTQLGLSVAVPPVCFILLAAWLKNSCGWGSWVLWVGIGLGIYCAIVGFVSSMRTLARLTKNKQQDKPAVRFNDHD